MSQQEVWEKEYKDLSLVSGTGEPTIEFKKFVKWIRKDQKRALEGLRVLDLGSGLGKNSIFLAERGAKVTGLEISKTAIKEAKKRAENAHVILSSIQDPESEEGSVSFVHHDIGISYPFEDKSFDLVLDVMSSNSLNEKGRSVYLKEASRVLKPGGYLYIQALCKDGDKNAENLIKNFPGKEKDTYTMPDLKLTERVFSKQDFLDLYGKYFKVIKLFEKIGHVPFKGKVYKRKYFIGYLQK